MNFFFCAKYADFAPSITKVFLRPLISSALCGASSLGVYTLLDRVTDSHFVTTLAAIAVAAVVYFVAILLLGALEKDDFDFIPKGKTLYRLLSKIRLVK